MGTITEIYDYLRVLYARVGHPHCPKCGRPIGRQTPDQIVDQVMELPEGTRFQVLAPIVRGRKGEYEKLLGELARKGFPRARIDGEVRELSEPIKLPKNYKHTIEVVVDRLVAKPDIRRRVADSIETALQLAEGSAAILVQTPEGHEEIQNFSQSLACTYDGVSFDELAPRNFSFNSPYGACPTCDGLGTHLEVDPELIVPDPDLSVAEGAIARVGQRPARVLGPRAGGRGRRPRVLARHAVEEARQEGAARSSSTARTRRSTSATRTGTTGSAPTTPPTRACVCDHRAPARRDGLRHRSATSSSSSCARSRAGRAAARA